MSKNEQGQQVILSEKVLTNIVIPQLGSKEQIGFVFAFRVDDKDNYQLLIDMNYTSRRFTEQLKNFLGDNIVDIDPE